MKIFTFFLLFLMPICSYARLCEVKSPRVKVSSDTGSIENENDIIPPNVISELSEGDYIPCPEAVYPDNGYLKIGQSFMENQFEGFVDAPSDKAKREVFLDGDPGKPVTLFKDPGKSWRDSQESAPRLGWPIIGDLSQKFYVLDVDTRTISVNGELRLLRTYKVEMIDKFGNKKVGWIDGDQTKKVPFSVEELAEYKKYEEPKTQVKAQTEVDTCLPCIQPSAGKKPEKELQSIQEQAAKNSIEFFEMVHDNVDKNKCVANNKADRPVDPKIAGVLSKGFKNYAQKVDPPKPVGTASRPTPDEYLMIDMLARTLWGEMRSCHKHGTRYYKAVARIIMNRTEALKRDGFIANERACDVNIKGVAPIVAMQCALGTPSQFTMWSMRDKNYPRLMCIRGDHPEWESAVRVATQAVLNPEKFNQSTRELANIRHFSSEVEIRRLREIKKVPKVDGLPLNRKNCLRFWAAK